MVASAAAFSMLLAGGAAAGAVPDAQGSGQADASGVWEGPYASQEAPVDVEPLEPRDAVEQVLPVADLQAGDEVVGERTASSKTFVGEEPGEFETRLYGEPVHFPVQGETEGLTEWVEIDTDLVDEGGERVAPAASGVDVSIAASLGDEALVAVDLGEGAGSISWGLSSVSGGSGGEVDPPPVPGQVEGSQVTYEVGEDVQVLVEAVPSGVKEDLVLAGPDVPTVYEFALALEGVDALEAGGGVHFTDAEGLVVAAIPAGFMQDAGGVFSDGVELSLTGEGAERVLRVELDGAWLSQEGRAFPVVVDPTVNLTTGLQDTHVESDRPTTNFSGFTFMRTGLNENGKRSRGLMKFDVSSLNGKTIDYAQLRLFNQQSLTCTPSPVTVHKVTQAWDQATVGWPGPAAEEGAAGSVNVALGGPGCAPGWANIWVNDLVRGWTSGQVANHGLSVRSAENSTTGFRRFATSEGTAAERPYLLVSWREPLLGSLGYYTLNSQQLSDRTQMHVNVATGNLMIQAADVQVPGVADMGLSIGRWYNSREETSAARAGIPGAGWTMDTGRDIRFSVSALGQSGYFEGPSGYRVVFPYNASLNQGAGGFDKPVGLNATATALASGPRDYKIELHESGLSYYFINGPALDYVQDQRGNRITMTYGSGERVSTITDTKGGVTTFTYGANDKVASITDPFGRVVSYGYSGLNLTSSTDFDGKVTRYAYDTNQNLTSLTDPRGRVTRFTYDSSERLTRIEWADSTPARAVVTTYTYRQRSGGRGWIVDMVDPNRGEPWTYVFDDKGRLETFYSPRSGVGESYAYDAFNSVTNYTTNSGGVGTAVYDGYNVRSFQADSGAKSEFDYDKSSTAKAPNRPIKFTDAKGVALNYQYNNDREMTQVSDDAGGIKARMTYQTQAQACPGALSTARDGNNNLTSYTYNSRCNLTRVTRPAPLGQTNLTYDALDRVASVTDGVGNRQVYTYDSLDRMTRVDYFAPGASTSTSRVSYTYDANGNRTTRTDVHPGQGTKTSRWTLDARNRLTAETLPNVTNAYSYDRAGNLAALTTPWGTTSYTYDTENDVATITPPVGAPITFDYYEHTYAAVVFPNGVRDAQHYDTDGRIQKIDQHRTGGGSSSTLARLNYSYTDPAGRPTDSVHQISDAFYDLQLDYTYDTNGRIKTSHGISEGDVFESNSYTYDNNSNRTAWTQGSRSTVNSYTAQYNGANQMTSTARAGGPTTTYSYDANGALRTGTDGTAISYDLRARAISTTHRNAGTLGAQAANYDGTSQVERTSYGQTTFRHSILGVSSTTTTEGTRNYVRAPDGRVLAEYRPNGTWRYYLTDHLGSIVGATDATGTRTESYGYDAYGDYTYGSGGGTNLIGFRYTGEWLDGNSVAGNGYYKIGLRNYDPSQGRWTQTDPLHRATNPAQPSEANPYNYAGCNPTNQTDPTGACSDGAIAGLAAIGLIGLTLSIPLSFPIATAAVIGTSALPAGFGTAAFSFSAIGGIGSLACLLGDD